MEHLFIGLAAGYGVYITWSELLYPKWWQPMVSGEHWTWIFQFHYYLLGHGMQHAHITVNCGKWIWIFAAVIGSMFYFVYSKRHFWISRIIFGVFMGLASGGIFREFYEIYFPQLRASMRPVTGNFWGVANTLLFYVILLSCMSYFFFSFEHKNKFIKGSSSLGRWLLMIGFGSIFGATIMGRLTLFIGRFNFLVNKWYPDAVKTCSNTGGLITVIVGSLIAAGIIILTILKKPVSPDTTET